jgi:hypothetical protein
VHGKRNTCVAQQFLAARRGGSEHNHAQIVADAGRQISDLGKAKRLRSDARRPPCTLLESNIDRCTHGRCISSQFCDHCTY